MTLRHALDRTLLLMRDWLSPDIHDDVLLNALTQNCVVLSADEATLTEHSAQCAFVTTALLLARSGHKVHLNAPNASLVGPQPPLALGHLIDGLVEVGQDLLPEWQFQIGAPDIANIEFILGMPTHRPRAELAFQLNASRWAGELSREPTGVWQNNISPFGGLAAAPLVATEAFKASMRTLKQYATTQIYDELFAATPKATLRLAPESTPLPRHLGRVDCVSGGALTNAALYSLARVLGVTGEFRVIEPERGDLTNLQRYMLMRRSRCELLKAFDLETQQLAMLNIEGLPFRYCTENKEQIGELAPNVLVGVDHIPSRWAVQRDDPNWMAIAATQGFEVMTSFHTADLACAGCAHPEYSEPDGPIPTVAFVSFISGLMMAAMLAEKAAVGGLPADRQATWFAPLQAGQPPSQFGLAVHPACPVHREAKAA